MRRPWAGGWGHLPNDTREKREGGVKNTKNSTQAHPRMSASNDQRHRSIGDASINEACKPSGSGNPAAAASIRLYLCGLPCSSMVVGARRGRSVLCG